MRIGLDWLLCVLEPDGDGSDGGGSGGDGAAGDGSGQGDGSSGGGTAGDGQGRTFTQSDVDRIVQERVARVKTAPPADYDDLKKKAEEFDKLQEAQKTELEKAQEARAKAERDAAAATERAQKTLVESAIVSEAVKRGLDTDVAVALVDRALLEFDDNDRPTNTADAVDSLLKAKPNLANGGSRGDADQGARSGNGANQLTREQLQTMSHCEIIKAQNEGRLDVVLGRAR